MKDFETLFAIAKRKSAYDQGDNWSNGSNTYLTGIKDEVDEVVEEIPKSRLCYLEDELGDVLWNYFNTLMALEKEVGIDPQSVFGRACRKYEERVSGIESGKRWKDVKERQKERLADEYKSSVS